MCQLYHIISIHDIHGFLKWTLPSLNLDISTESKRGFNLKSKNRMANSVDLDVTARHEPSHLDQHYLHKYLFWSTGLKGSNLSYIFVIICGSSSSGGGSSSRSSSSSNNTRIYLFIYYLFVQTILLPMKSHIRHDISTLLYSYNYYMIRNERWCRYF